MMNNDLYVWIDKELNFITSLPEKLPSNWKNISGLDNLDQDTLKTFGWYKIDDPDLLNFEYNDEWLTQLKNKLLDNVANQRWEAQTQSITYNGNTYILNDQTINSLYQKRLIVASDPDITFSWKTRDSIVLLNGVELINLTNSINSYIQQCFDIEKDIINHLSQYSTLEELLQLDLNINWPSTELT